MKNLITRSITGVLFVAIIVVCFMRPEAMILLFALVTGLTVWEYTGLVNQIDGVTVNRFISTAAGVYLFLAIAGFCSGITPSAVFIPYLLSVIYLFISELYTESKNAINNWHSETSADRWCSAISRRLASSSSFGQTIREPTASARSSANTSCFRE